ncbi:MAG: TIGR01212 family radical SAM protein [Bacteroidales bacterium]|jgi:radical SAM protein (TIGR01212 family)|nr:TIGR01212 family radical SAM protein [Bacteroidales bacterium]
MISHSQNKLLWNDYSSYIKDIFGVRVQKISVNAGFTCPNRDNLKGEGGCIYCTNKSFSPFYCSPEISIVGQLQKGISFFSEKYKSQKYLAYFQAFTNTYANIDILKKLYYEALSVDGVEGLVIATRPDCINKEILSLLSKIADNKYVSIEFGAESTNDETLKFINRGHTYQQTINAVELTKSFGINCGLHLILGLPGENEDDFYRHAENISKLPLNTLKVHQMQVLKNTRLAKIYYSQPDLFIDLSLENYIRIIINFLELLNPRIIIDRFTSESPKDMLIYPNWGGKKNFEVAHLVNSEMKKINSYQGKKYKNEIL